MAKTITLTFEVETEKDDEGAEYVDYLRLITLTTSGEVSLENVKAVIDYLENVEDGEYDTMFDVKSRLRQHAHYMEITQDQQES